MRACVRACAPLWRRGRSERRPTSRALFGSVGGGRTELMWCKVLGPLSTLTLNPVQLAIPPLSGRPSPARPSRRRVRQARQSACATPPAPSAPTPTAARRPLGRDRPPNGSATAVAGLCAVCPLLRGSAADQTTPPHHRRLSSLGMPRGHSGRRLGLPSASIGHRRRGLRFTRGGPHVPPTATLSTTWKRWFHGCSTRRET